ncbi:hypothetical protein PTKIN_Ptkin18bG0108400 [Pterospermum kingtungense]
MDGSKNVMENLESLWFFYNVLTLTAYQPQDHASAIVEDTVEEEEEPPKSLIQGVPSTAHVLVPWCPNCGEIAVGIEQKVVEPVKMEETAKPTEKPERSRRRRRRRKRSKRKVLGELDLGFHGNLASESSFSEETYGCSNFQIQSQKHYTKMPALNDGLAMKEHLKSWAYAVACTVR